MTYFTLRSRGVGLGFVVFYMRYIVIPITLLAAFIKPKNSSVIFGLVIIFMLYSWYEINPLRVILMLVSFSMGYILLISLRDIYKNHLEQTKSNNN
jgi:D-alanyl-lipoteichoic acid acyltransferase DltB (MBOAT superfamily)